jgi:multidrug efflux pump subunit AcrA (membrane-fusion protein)
MTYRAGIVVGVLGTLLVVGIIWWIVNPDPVTATPAASTKSPATIPKPLKEESLGTFTLSDDAVDLLKLKIGKVERREIARVRMYGGEIIVPTGRSVIVSSPLGGVLTAADEPPQAGASVRKGQVVLRLQPLLTPESRATLAASKSDAEGQIKIAQTQLDAAKLALDRAKRLLRGEAGSRRAVDEAEAEVEYRTGALEAANSRYEVLAKAVGEFESGTASPLDIASPQAGVLLNVAALPGQNVPAGAALFEVADLQKLWAKVPVYVADTSQIDAAAPARVSHDFASAAAGAQPAKPVAAPPSADAAAGTVHYFYEIDNELKQYQPGQRVGVTLTLKGDAAALCAPRAGGVMLESKNRDEPGHLCVPWSAVVYDIHGGTWVYEPKSKNTFVRHRVLVCYVVDDTAVLAGGPKVGTAVVTARALELFGTETGYTK